MEQNYLIYLLEAVVTTIVLGTIAIPLLKKLKARQSVREEGPKSHRSKNGTPTMGGIFMILSAVLVLLFNKILDPAALWLLFLTLGHGILGFLDDFIKAGEEKESGLTANAKDARADYFGSSVLLGSRRYTSSALLYSYSFHQY